MPDDVTKVTDEVDGPTPFTDAVIIDPEIDPTEGVTDKRIGVKLMPEELSVSVPAGTPTGR